MGYMDDEWLRNASDIFYSLDNSKFLYQVWDDFIHWTAYQVSYHTKETVDSQTKILQRYPDGTAEQFWQLYRIVNYQITQNPHRNVLLKLMDYMRLSGGYIYDEDEARDIIFCHNHKLRDDLSVRWTQFDSPDIEQNIICDENFVLPGFDDSCKLQEYASLWECGKIVFIDDDCSQTMGSRLIAVANLFSEYCPNFPDHIMLAAADPHNLLYALMAFIQMSIMGMACYSLTNSQYRIPMVCHSELFAPPFSVFSEASSSEAWHRERFRAVLSAGESSL